MQQGAHARLETTTHSLEALARRLHAERVTPLHTALQPARPGAARRTRRRERAREALSKALWSCGIVLDGTAPHDVQVLDPRFYDLGAFMGSARMRDAYVAGLWDTQALDEVTWRVLRHAPQLRNVSKLQLGWLALSNALRNPQARRRASRGVQHYQLGEALFRAMLDRRMIYSCAYFRRHSTLDEAQEAKLDLVCRKLRLAPGMRLLDIGCGWGGLARFAAERYGVEVVGITPSSDQASVARRECAGLPIEIRQQSYHALQGSAEHFDAIASLGMFEHVGPRNYARYFRIARELLVPSGLFLLHTIGGSRTARAFDPWMQRHIFPNAFLPSMRQITTASEGRWIIEDWHNFGADYDKTLMAWHARFERAWPALREHYDERFHRMWKCYLLCCAGAFRARVNQLWQIVLSPSGVPGGYESVR